MERLPQASIALIAGLEAQIRPPRPRPGMSHDQIIWDAARYSVLEDLQRLRDTVPGSEDED
jgi:hypothetical protein